MIGSFFNKIVDNYNTNRDIDNFIQRTQAVINKVKKSNDNYSIDELKPNQLFKYKTTTIQNNPHIKEYISELKNQGIQVEFSKFDSAANKILLYTNNKLQIIECVQ